jgi:hypothetical protein
MINWKGGKRSLTVIDEALANIIDTYQVRAEDLRQVLSYLSPELTNTLPSQVLALETVKDLLEQVADLTKTMEGDDKHRSRIVWRGIFDGKESAPSDVSMLPLRDAMKSLKYDFMVLRKESPLDRRRIADIVDRTLVDVESILVGVGTLRKA